MTLSTLAVVPGANFDSVVALDPSDEIDYELIPLHCRHATKKKKNSFESWMFLILNLNSKYLVDYKFVVS